MDYNETIKFLYNQLPVYQNSGNKALNLGLDKIQKLLIEFNNPEKFLKIIHIGGTNGKGTIKFEGSNQSVPVEIIPCVAEPKKEPVVKMSDGRVLYLMEQK